MYHKSGVHAIVDGQFGSTGKGALAAYIAKHHGASLDVVVSNAGPNSGHTFYGPAGEKVVLKQLPTLAVATKMFHDKSIPIFLSAGAVIDPEILNKEVDKFNAPVFLSAQAAVVTQQDKDSEHSGSVAAVAGTRQGVGAAIARKVLRDPSAVVDNMPADMWHRNIHIIRHVPNWSGSRIGLEVSQGFSLGINSQFYPKVTSRECTVMQGLADARIPAQRLQQTLMVVRTYPIRVGNVDGNDSGGCYADQMELSWNQLGVTPETTTVTGRVRRVFTFSHKQFREALSANMPRTVMVNFMNYIQGSTARLAFAKLLADTALDELKFRPDFLYGFGPTVDDISTNPVGTAGGTNGR